MAPPFTLTLSRLSPSSFSTARYWPANASLTSIRSMSSRVSPAFFNAILVDGTGPDPMILGSTPAIPQLTMRPSGFRPRFSASSSGITTTAAPPSTIPLALPAVTVLFGVEFGGIRHVEAAIGVEQRDHQRIFQFAFAKANPPAHAPDYVRRLR